MKKIIFITLIFVGALMPLSIFAQKKQVKTILPPAPNLKMPSDTLSYALGVNMAQGLPEYLSMLGVIADTASISNQYKPLIDAEDDAVKKASIEKEYKTKMDSANAINNRNLPIFLNGFMQAMSETDKDVLLSNSGIAIAEQIKNSLKNFPTGSNESINNQIFLAGLLTSLRNQPLLIDNPQQVMENCMNRMQEENDLKAAEELKSQYADKIAEEAKFFEENKSKPGIIVRPSGLQYKIEKKGTGIIPEVNDKVKVHYHGTLLDGTVFDSSVDRGEPIEFNVGQLIRGFNEALLLMPKGSKWTLYIPYELAYGGKDMGVIKPFSGLIFEVELLDVEKDMNE